MVRVHLVDKYGAWLFKTELVGWDHFVKLYNAKVIRKHGKVYVRTDNVFFD